METLFHLFSGLALFAEGFMVMSVTSSMCGRRVQTKKHFPAVGALAVAYALIVGFVGAKSELYFASALAAVCWCFVSNLALSKGSVILRLAALTVTWFFIHAFDYAFSYAAIIAAELAGNENAAAVIAGSGIGRILFVSVDRLLQLSAVFVLRKAYPSLRKLEKKYLWLLFAVSFGAYLMMTVFAGLIVSDATATIQIAVIFSGFFLVLSLVVTLFAVTVKTNYEKEKRENELMAMTNSMLKKNFTQMHNSHNAVRQQVHDFKNHLIALNGMLEKDESAKQYVEDLLAVSYRRAKFCQSGNDVIDSIINCKISEAETLGISFSQSVTLSSPLYFSSVDICAVLANQIDNALEACAKIPDTEEKSVRVEVWQKESFAFFKVTNTCKENPFNEKRELVSAKKDPSGIHGYGIKNITKTTEKYGGTVKSDYCDGTFVSVAMLPNNKQ